MRIRQRSINFLYCLAFISFSFSVHGQSVKILTIGNSFADNACKYLKEITESVAGCDITITKANIGGCPLDKHADLIDQCAADPNLKPYYKKYTLLELLGMDAYDFVTIQQVSTKSFKKETFHPYADRLYAFVQEHAPSAQVLIHETWAYHENSPRYSEWGVSRDEMHQGLVKNYHALSKHLKSGLLPSGEAFYNTFAKDPEVSLWSDDNHHANANGCYLAGCVWFGVLFDQSPKGIEFVPEGMDPKTAKFLRKMAAKEVKRNAKLKMVHP